jgi:bifunctional enzyme CysN/CysC
VSFAANTMDLLRFLTAGSVDDGKSTLIGRLLYEAGGVYDDQLASVRKIAEAKNRDPDLALITDGLKAEREQGITIDVAYRYFSTVRRKFIIADTPGHLQYTRNMTTAASTADVAVILLDARRAVLEQTRRHAYIAWLLGIRHIIVAINKMDLVNFRPDIFLAACESFRLLASFAEEGKSYFIPVSALLGDNVVHRSDNMPWYNGPSLLELLETIPIGEQHVFSGLRFPIQSVIRPNQTFRGYAGQVVSGRIRPGQEVLALPSRRRVRIAQLLLHERRLKEAIPPLSIVLSLSDEIDLSRGDMLVDPEDQPIVSQRVIANLIWMSQRPLRVGSPYLIKHSTQTLCGSALRLLHKLDIHILGNIEADTLELNDIGTVELETHRSMFCEPYSTNRTMGSFIVIDPVDNSTAAGGMIVGRCSSSVDALLGRTSFSASRCGGQRLEGLTVWFTGLSGAGKTTISNAVHTELLARGIRAELLDADVLRKHLNSDLGFSKSDRCENIRRIGFLAGLLTRNGVVTLVAAISPYREIREEVRRTIPNFIEVYVNAPLEVCEQRDPKGLYKRARAREILGFTGIDDAYEPPRSPEVICNTDLESIRSCADKVVGAILNFQSSMEAKQADAVVG